MPKNQAAPIAQDAAIQEMNKSLFEAPIAELAESQGISIDEAVRLRVEKSIEAAPLPIEVSVRPVEPMGSLRGYLCFETAPAIFSVSARRRRRWRGAKEALETAVKIVVEFYSRSGYTEDKKGAVVGTFLKPSCGRG